MIYETSAILDPYNSFNYLEVDNKQLAYVNIYFDITEIFSRRLDAQLQNLSLSIAEINDIYDALNKERLSWQKNLEKETDAGQKILKLKEWNDRISDELAIDNFDISSQE